MNTVTNQNRFIVRRFETFCPFDGVTTCLASLSSLVLDNEKRTSCCSTDSFEDCPLFLSKVLRRS